MNQVIIPENYHSVLSMYETQDAIGIIKEMMQKKLCMALRLKRVTAPLFVDPASGLNDDLNGVERPVSFEIPAAGVEAQVVHSLAKWKRMALYRYDFRVGKGILTDMNAIRRDEELDNLHSCYVDQWDWEKVIDRSDRNEDYLKAVVKRIVGVICNTLDELKYYYPQLELELNRDVAFVTTQELEDRYPDLTPKQRENVFVKEHGTAFIMKIGDKLKSGEPHDGRAPDYDDWALNGDILFWHDTLDCALEMSGREGKWTDGFLRYDRKRHQGGESCPSFLGRTMYFREGRFRCRLFCRLYPALCLLSEPRDRSREDGRGDQPFTPGGHLF